MPSHLFVGLPALFFTLIAFPVTATELSVIGWLEYVDIDGGDMQYEAKIDTGADVSSINADIIKEFTRNNLDWVQLALVNKEGQRIILEKQILRYAKIKRKQALPVKRPVISLGVCLGDQYRKIEVNLAKRKNFKYKLLIGRNFLRGTYLVDSSNTYTTQPGCNRTGSHTE